MRKNDFGLICRIYSLPSILIRYRVIPLNFCGFYVFFLLFCFYSHNDVYLLKTPFVGSENTGAVVSGVIILRPGIRSSVCVRAFSQEIVVYAHADPIRPSFRDHENNTLTN